MARAPHASDIVQDGYQMLVEITPDQPLKGKAVSKVRMELARGSAILVHGWSPQQAMEFTMEDLTFHRYPCTESTSWQGRLDDLHTGHIVICLTSFLTKLHQRCRKASRNLQETSEGKDVRRTNNSWIAP